MSTTASRGYARSPVITVLSIVVLVWLLIGVLAAVQRHYFSSASTNCAKVSTTVVTILAGPLNYMGVNPKVSCALPEPSK